MFVPLWDLNHLQRVRFQYVTVGIILVNCIVYFALQLGLVYPVSEAVQVSFALVPHDFIANILHRPLTAPAVKTIIPERLTLLTYMFLHGNFMHLFGNMIFLWVFGDNVEDAMGNLRFLFFYLTCGIAAGLTHILMSPNSDVPMIGASGAVSGVIAAYLILYPNVRVWCLWFFRIPLRVSAAFALLFWIGLQILSILFSDDGTVALWAHVGGLMTGAVLILFMRRPGVQLFNRTTGLEPPQRPNTAGRQEA